MFCRFLESIYKNGHGDPTSNFVFRIENNILSNKIPFSMLGSPLVVKSRLRQETCVLFMCISVPHVLNPISVHNLMYSDCASKPSRVPFLHFIYFVFLETPTHINTLRFGFFCLKTFSSNSCFQIINCIKNRKKNIRKVIDYTPSRNFDKITSLSLEVKFLQKILRNVK